MPYLDLKYEHAAVTMSSPRRHALPCIGVHESSYDNAAPESTAFPCAECRPFNLSKPFSPVGGWEPMSRWALLCVLAVGSFAATYAVVKRGQSPGGADAPPGIRRIP